MATRRKQDVTSSMTSLPVLTASNGYSTSLAPLSSYSIDYRGVEIDPTQLNQRLLTHLKACDVEEKGTPLSVYQLTHCNKYSAQNSWPEFAPPDLGAITASTLGSAPTVRASSRILSRRARLNKETVASSLVWYQPPEKVPSCSAGTQTQDLTTVTKSLTESDGVEKSGCESTVKAI